MWSGTNNNAAVSLLQNFKIIETKNSCVGRIVFRALQGLGGSGTYALALVIFFELVPPEQFAKYTSLVSAVLSFALSLGPLLGGLINNYTTWRWIFLLKHV